MMPKIRLAANLSLLFTEHPFLERFGAAAQEGFRAVEIQFPYDFAIKDIRDQLEHQRLDLVLHNVPAGDWSPGERGIAVLPERVDEFRNSIDLAAAYASGLGCRRLNCLSGIAPADLEPELCLNTYLDNLRFAADRLAPQGVDLLIEPINTVDIPGFFLNRLEQALDVVETVGADNLRVQFDVYHMHIMGEDVCKALRDHHDLIGHIQIADHPGRHEPGTGKIDFAAIFDCLSSLDYSGWIGCEYLPNTSTSDGLGWRNMLDRTV